LVARCGRHPTYRFQEAEMKNVARILSMLAVMTIGLATSSPAADKPGMLANAIVKDVSGSSLTVTADAKDQTFVVDAKTKVTGKGIGTKSKAKGGKPTIADLLQSGDRVTVKYQTMGTMMHATGIEVTASK
jgi:hypothetical protein